MFLGIVPKFNSPPGFTHIADSDPAIGYYFAVAIPNLKNRYYF
jgi:hypothetical protein